jgi:hypothetical protein
MVGEVGASGFPLIGGFYEDGGEKSEDGRLVGEPKKNWLFIGHPDAGWRSAVIYSLLITARRYRLDPAAWLSHVLRRIPTCPSCYPGTGSLRLPDR